MSSIETAIELAAIQHAGATDKAGAPYIFHPLRVMFTVSTPFEKMAAVLHDVVEDTDLTLNDLQEMNFPNKVVEAVDALTKRDGETRLDAAKRAAKNKIALVVKLADIKDNMDLSRIHKPTDRDYSRLDEYQQVKKYLESRTTIKPV